ncbi:MAG: phosphatidylserine decarboxylase family protein [Proteobacteria bacterium]|nr:phosphatidylserine decarboxylase family protein [Pseudomonadota bacterium]MBU4471424.1 phosphatidylserine decarboxylase family protein [Pseudomonadota bacterium]MCG2752429.1 phosphatidylserine decarboxylase family protein [Desulfobacteraceae bacterium]
MNPYEGPDRPSVTAFPIAKAGFPFIYASAFASAIFALLGLKIPAILLLGATFFICFFFRDPDRVIPASPGAVISPADGRIIVAEKIGLSPFYKGPCFKISIFMNIFNVHVNRIVQEGEVVKIDYRPGKFYSADQDKAGLENEHNAVFIKTESGRELCIVQVAGLIARRIICTVQKGEVVKRGQKFGLICFGSRLDVYLPEDFKVEVAPGDKVKAGETLLGEII